MCTCLLSILLIAWALLSFFGKDIVWSWHESSLERQGIDPSAIHRNQKWDETQDLYGIILLMFAIVAFIAFLAGAG